MVFIRHNMHSTQNSRVSYYRLVSSCPSLIARFSSIIKMSLLCSFLFMWMASSSQIHPLNWSNGLLPLQLNFFSLKVLSPLAYFLGVEAIHTSSSLFLSQYKYIHDLLEKHNMLGANDVSIPLSSIMSFKLHNGAPPTNPTKYRQVIAIMQYLSLGRPGISFVVNKLSQFMHYPSTTYWLICSQEGSSVSQRHQSSWPLSS